MSRVTTSTWSVSRADSRFRRFPSAKLSYTTTCEAPSARTASTTWDPICPARPVTRTSLPFSEGMSFRSSMNLNDTRISYYFVYCTRNVLDIGFGHLWEQRQAQNAIRKPGSARIIVALVREAPLVVRLQVDRDEVESAADVLCF